MNSNFLVLLLALMSLPSCQTAKTGGKVVDRSRGEIIISSSGDQRSALPEASQDSSLTDARVRLIKATQKDPTDINSLLSLAQLQLAQDQFRDAEDSCQKVLRMDIKSQEARKILAQSSIRQDLNDKAMIFLSALGGEQSRDSSVINMLGLVSFSRGDSSDAMRLWKHALTLNANDISARMNLGVMYLKYRLLSQASAHFERILKVAPEHQDAKLHLAIIYGSRGAHEQSIATYKSILKSDPNNTLVLFNLAVSQNAITAYDDAIDSLKAYIKASPSKSTQTDQAFALLEDINTNKQAKGQKISDSEIRALAANLNQKRGPAKSQDKSVGPPVAPTPIQEAPQKSTANREPIKKAPKIEKQPSDLGDDKGIDELENELRAH